MFRFFLILTIICTNISFSGASNSDASLLEFEKTINKLIERISQETSNAEKNRLNDELISVFYDALQVDGSFNFPFESIKNIGNLKSSDNRVRIITWNIPQVGGLQRYFGFVQIRAEEKVNTFPLTDNRGSIEKPQIEELKPENWYGALYYSIKEVNQQGKTFYTLLGVDLNNYFSTKRIIDVLYVNKNNEPIFGFPLFRIQNSIINRVIFEYSARANMVLRWSDEVNMIVFDHLTPLRPDYRDNFQFYVPDLSFDGFKYDNTYWVYTPDIDIRNESRVRQPRPKAPEENIDPGFLYRTR
jgi:hypothetical protein